MLFKSFSLFISLAQAAQILRGSISNVATSSDIAIQSTQVNGTLTSFSVIEGSGCPAGTYHAQPIEPGKSLNTYVDFDAGTFLYNSTTTTAPVTCTFSFDFEFIYPEDGEAQIDINSITYNDARFEEGDVDRETNFNVQYDMIVAAGDVEFDGSIVYTRIVDEGPAEFDVGAFMFTEGTPGEVGIGTFQVAISISTTFGPGEFSISQIGLGFGLYYSRPI